MSLKSRTSKGSDNGNPAKSMAVNHRQGEVYEGITAERRHNRSSGEDMFIDGGFVMKMHPRTSSALIAAMAAAITLFSAAASTADRSSQDQEEWRSSRAGNGPGPAANGPGPGCNLIPP